MSVTQNKGPAALPLTGGGSCVASVELRARRGVPRKRISPYEVLTSLGSGVFFDIVTC